MVDVYNEVTKIFIKSKSPIATESDTSDTDSESEKLDIAQGEGIGDPPPLEDKKQQEKDQE